MPPSASSLANFLTPGAFSKLYRYNPTGASLIISGPSLLSWNWVQGTREEAGSHPHLYSGAQGAPGATYTAPCTTASTVTVA